MSGIGLSYELVVYDRDGNVIERRKEPGHSFTHNFYSMLETLLKDGGVYRGYAAAAPLRTNVIDSSGTLISMSSCCFTDTTRELPGGFSCNPSCAPILGVNGLGTVLTSPDLVGIVVGSGTAASTAVVGGITRKYRLGAQIEHGTGSGQLVYDTMMLFPEVQVQDSVLTVQLQRLFVNNSGGTVTIKEIGLFNRCNKNTSVSGSGSGKYDPADILTIYDSLIGVYPNGLSLENSEMIGVTYDIIFNAPD